MLENQVPGLLPLAAGAMLGLALLLAGTFHRGRAALAALALLWLWACLGGSLHVLPLGDFASGRMAELAVTLTPLNLFLILLLKETPLLNWRGGLLLGVLALQTLAGSFLPFEYWDRIWALERLPAAYVPLDWRDVLTPLPGLSSLFALLGALIGGVLVLRRRNSVDAGVTVALLASGILPWWFLAGGTAWPWLMGAGAVLLISAGHASYRMAFLDALTGLPGRRMLDERLARLGRRYSVAMVDVDHFKQFNDTHGHEVGDQVLKLVAATLRRHFGGNAYRYGGEEFTVLFVGRAAEKAAERCDAFRTDIEQRELVLRGKDRPAKPPRSTGRSGRAKARPALGITLSIGIAERNDDRRTPEAVQKAADDALYKAKRAGRNQVVVSGARVRRRRSAVAAEASA